MLESRWVWFELKEDVTKDRVGHFIKENNNLSVLSFCSKRVPILLVKPELLTNFLVRSSYLCSHWPNPLRKDISLTNGILLSTIFTFLPTYLSPQVIRNHGKIVQDNLASYLRNFLTCPSFSFKLQSSIWITLIMSRSTELLFGKVSLERVRASLGFTHPNL